MRELFELLQINSELFEPNLAQTSSNSDPERIPTPQPSEDQESSSYESKYDSRYVNFNVTVDDNLITIEYLSLNYCIKYSYVPDKRVILLIVVRYSLKPRIAKRSRK